MRSHRPETRTERLLHLPSPGGVVSHSRKPSHRLADEPLGPLFSARHCGSKLNHSIQTSEVCRRQGLPPPVCGTQLQLYSWRMPFLRPQLDRLATRNARGPQASVSSSRTTLPCDETSLRTSAVNPGTDVSWGCSARQVHCPAGRLAESCSKHGTGEFGEEPQPRN